MRRSKLLFRWLSGWLLLCMLGVGVLGGAGLSARAAPVQQVPLSIVINEIAWMGTRFDANDEWIELYNPSGSDINLTGWQLLFKSNPTTIATTINLSPNSLPGNILPAGGYFLLERTDDTSTSLTADLVYSGGLSNTGMILELVAPGNVVVDTANKNGGGWPGGSNASAAQRSSMERISHILDTDANWGTNDGVTVIGLDSNNQPLRGTPKQQNSIFAPAPAAPAIEILINEVAWAGTLASSDDEWIELYNPSLTDTIDISNWRLVTESGMLDVIVPTGTSIAPDSYFLMERARPEVTNATHNFIYFGALSDSGEVLRLRKPDGTIVDTANSDGGSWPAGSLTSTGSMERMGVLADAPLSWVTNAQPNSALIETDAGGNKIQGTPGRTNWGFSVTHTPVPTNTFPPPPTSTPTSTSTVAPTTPLTIVISEVAWAGTLSSSDDEWMELYNPGSQSINLTNWNLVSSDGSPNIKAEFNNIVIGPGEYLLLERTDDDPTDVPAKVIYSGSLSNSGEILRLYDPNGFLVDSANSNGGLWPAGVASNFSSMQRSVLSADSNFTWVTYDPTRDSGTKAKDASGNEIKGTPGRANAPFNVTATPTPRNTAIPGSGSGSGSGGVVPPPPIIGISEFLPRPGYDWNNDGVVDVFDEFVEIINAGRVDVNLSSYRLDDEENLGSVPYTLPSITLRPDERAVFYASETGILLSDAGDTVRLLRGNTVVDAYTYPVVRSPDQSYCRIPDRLGYWNDPCFPTPNNANALTGTIPLPARPVPVPQVCLLPDTAPDVFVYAECEAGGDGIWNRRFWDEADAASPVILEEGQKWETVFE